MSTDFKTKLRSLQFSKGLQGTSVRKPVIDERDGSVGGYHLEHWDDSQDAHITPKTLKIQTRQEED